MYSYQSPASTATLNSQLDGLGTTQSTFILQIYVRSAHVKILRKDVSIPPTLCQGQDRKACFPPPPPPFYKFISNSLSLKCSLLWPQLYGRFSPISLTVITQLFTVTTVNDVLHSFIVKFLRIALVS